jgi:hypothetical protein
VALQPPAGRADDCREDGLPSFGRGFLAGEYVFWPTRRRLWVLSVEDGEQPYDLIPGELEKAPPGNIAHGEASSPWRGPSAEHLHGAQR